MPNKKLTDNEIAKALECCNNGWCDGRCPYYGKEDIADCREQSGADLLDLINRQKTQIAELESEIYRKGVAIMGDQMTFPENFDEFAEQYKITDTEQVYTNGTELIPIFRVKQWLTRTIHTVDEHTAKIKAEAYREFAEELHEELRIYGVKDKFNKAVFLNVVDNAKKELVGEDG